MRKGKVRNPYVQRPASTVSNYAPRNDGTVIDNFVADLKNHLNDGTIKFAVSGLASQPRRFPVGRNWIEVSGTKNCADGSAAWVKTYKVGLLIPPDRWGLSDLVQRTKEVEPYSTENYVDVYLKPIADRVYDHVYECVARHDKDFVVTAGIKSNGRVSAWITLSLAISTLDLILQSRSDLTEYPKQYLKELAAIVERQLATDPKQMVALYKDVDVRYAFLREAEQELRRMHHVPLIGEGNISETSLHRLLKKHFPDAEHEYSPTWLGKQRFDIYIPSLKMAIEYNGPQHYGPLELFGGEEGFRETRRRDEITNQSIK